MTVRTARDVMPLIANLELTNRCNLHCLYCANRRMKRARADMSLETLALVMQRIEEAHIRQVILNTIGETLLAPHLGDAIRESKARGLHILVSTNGQLLNELQCELLVASCDVIRISVNAADESTYRRLHAGGSLEDLVSKVRMLVAVRDELRADCTIRVRSVVRAGPGRERAMRELDSYWAPRVDQVEFVTFGNMGGRNGEKPIDDPRRTRCATMWRGFNVMFDGAVGYCPCDVDGQTGVGSLRRMSFRQVWQSRPFRAVRLAHISSRLADYPRCEDCDATRVAWYETKRPALSAKEAEIMDSYLSGWQGSGTAKAAGHAAG